MGTPRPLATQEMPLVGVDNPMGTPRPLATQGEAGCRRSLIDDVWNESSFFICFVFCLRLHTIAFYVIFSKGAGFLNPLLLQDLVYGQFSQSTFLIFLHIDIPLHLQRYSYSSFQKQS
jgi:hypothetical protein